MSEINNELEMIKRIQLSADEMMVVSRCKSINEQTPLSKACRFLGRYPLLLVLIFLALIWGLISYGNLGSGKIFHRMGLVASLLFFLLLFCQDFYLWIIIKKQAMHIKYLEKKLESAREFLK